MPKPTNLGLWSTNGGTTVEPLLAEKQAGWPNSFRPPARWFNWWMNNQYLWNIWLDAFESTAHTWTALQTYSGDILATGAGTNSDGTIQSTGSGNRAGLHGTSGSTTGAYGVKGVGVDGGALGKNGVAGLGGTGTTAGGIGSAGIGGASAGATGLGGIGGAYIGGALDGTTNTGGVAGIGVDSTGGEITSDANARLGGIGNRSTGGLGQSGYGAAYKAVHGNLEVDDGSIIQAGLGGPGLNQILDTLVSGDLEVTDDLIVGDTATFGGLITPNGGIAIEAAINVAGGIGFQGTWADATGIGSSAVAYFKDPFGIVHLQGAARSGTSGTTAFTLPVGYRPPGPRQYTVKDFGTSVVKFVTIDTNGDVKMTFGGTGGNDAPTLDGINFRT